MGMHKSWEDSQLVKACIDNTTISGVLRDLGLSPTGGNYKNIRLHIDRLELDISHFLGRRSNKGRKFCSNKAIPLEKILVKDSTYTNTTNLKNKLLKVGLLTKSCYNCGRTRWLGDDIPLQLHHINGDNIDNRLINLSLLCPNCHSLTDNHCSKNKKARKSLSEKVYIKKPKVYVNCPICGKRMEERYTACSRKCRAKLCQSNQRSLDWDNINLVSMINSGMSYTSISKELGVSDTTIKKWYLRQLNNS